MAQALLICGADVNVQGECPPLRCFAPMSDIAVLDYYEQTPLHRACSSGQTEVVRCLLKFNPDSSIRGALIFQVREYLAY